jgi:hypothetical protein
MAIYLFRLIRGKLRENQAKKAIPTTDESHLVPDIAPGRGQQKLHNSDPTHGQLAIPCSTLSQINSLAPEEAARQKEEASKRTARQWNLMIGLILPNFLASVDVTIVAPAIPLISSHFSMLSSYNIYTWCRLTQVPRSSFWKLQLDRSRVHSHVYHLCTGFWAIG